MLKILIVDDEKQIREGLSETVDWNSIGIKTVLTARNGIEAFALFKEHKPELVITDIRMPGMDGLELCQSIKEYNPLSKILLLSGHSDFHYAKQGILIGVNNYFTKPVDISELISFSEKMVQEIIGEKQENDEVIKNHQPIDKNKRLHSGHKSFDETQITKLVTSLCYEKIIDNMNAIFEQIIKSESRKTAINLGIKIIQSLKIGFNDFSIQDSVLLEGSKVYINQIEKSQTNKEIIKAIRGFIITGLGCGKAKVICSNNKNVAVICEYIEDNFYKELSSEIIADYVNRNNTYLSHLFKTKTGMSINDYICAIRVEQAKKMLRDTSLMAYEIADEVGINSYKYFYGIFKKFVGLTPTDYRNRYLSKDVFI